MKKIDEKSTKFEKKHNHYLDKRKEIMENIQFRVEDIFGDNINKVNTSPEQITKLNNFSAKMM